MLVLDDSWMHKITETKKSIKLSWTKVMMIQRVITWYLKPFCFNQHTIQRWDQKEVEWVFIRICRLKDINKRVLHWVDQELNDDQLHIWLKVFFKSRATLNTDGSHDLFIVYNYQE